MLNLRSESQNVFIHSNGEIYKKELEDTKRVITIRKSKKDRQHNGQRKKDIQQSTKHYTENLILSNTNPTINSGISLLEE